MYFYENAQKELFFFSFQTLAISQNIQAECLISIISHIAPALPAGTPYILEYLHYRDIKVGLATSTREEVVKKELSEGGLFEYFDEIVCGDMVKRSKPEPDIYLEACKRLQVSPENCYGIEDSYNGIRALKGAGMHAVMVPDLANPTKEMEELAECILPSLLEVKKYLEEVV